MTRLDLNAIHRICQNYKVLSTQLGDDKAKLDHLIELFNTTLTPLQNEYTLLKTEGKLLKSANETLEKEISKEDSLRNDIETGLNATIKTLMNDIAQQTVVTTDRTTLFSYLTSQKSAINMTLKLFWSVHNR